MNELATEDQRLLTEFLGECWHEEGMPTGMSYHPFRCKKCNKPLHVSGKNGLDFSDWRVVGRLIEKCRSAQTVKLESNFESGISVDSSRYYWSPVAETPQLAICNAVLAYLKEKKDVL